MAIGITKLKGYKISVVFTSWELYPIYVAELLYWFFQINAFMGNYQFVNDPYPSLLQKLSLLVLLIPIIKHKLYIPAVLGAILTITGTFLNNIVISANSGFMPVYPSLSKLTGYYKEGMLSQGLDNLHIMLTSETKLNFLADFIDIGWSVMSIGDVLIHSFTAIIICSTIIAVNNKNKAKKKEVVE